MDPPNLIHLFQPLKSIVGSPRSRFCAWRLESIKKGGTHWDSTGKYIGLKYIPSRKVTYPTLGKGKSSSNMPWEKDMLVPRRVHQFHWDRSLSHSFVQYVLYVKVATSSFKIGGDRDGNTSKETTSSQPPLAWRHLEHQIKTLNQNMKEKSDLIIHQFTWTICF